jgi:hypothetical protein
MVSGSEYCALRHAAALGLVEYVSELARIPTVNGNLRGGNGETALIAATKGGWSQKKALDLVRAILLIPRLRLNIRDHQGRTALFHAMGKGWYDVVNLLMDAGANPKVEDEDETSAVTLAGQQIRNIPSDLFQRVLLFAGETIEDHPEVASPEDGYSPPSDPLAEPAIRTPGIRVKTPPDDSSPSPIVHQAKAVVQDFAMSGPPMQVQPGAPLPKSPEDKDDLSDVMEGQAIDESLEKDFLFSPGKGQRWRLHRKAVLAEIESILKQLMTTGDALTPADCARKDPSSGLNLWQCAAVHGMFLELLKAMARSNRWPETADLMVKTEDGRSLTDFLEESAQLSAILNDGVWTARPKLLASLLASLPEWKIRSYASLVAKTNLLILNAGR